jgi:hypothetical protein
MTRFRELLETIEARHGVRILHACESGSRAWGFASPDSDFDIRFIFVRTEPEYLAVEPAPDTIDLPIDGDLDAGGDGGAYELPPPTMENPYAPPVTSSAPAKDDIARQLEGIQYPLTLSFKILALASQATVTDATGRTVLHTKQKLLKFREHVEIWTDKSRSTVLAEIKANKVIDWSARYFSTDAHGVPIGSVGRRGWRSIWRAHYEVFNPGDNAPDFSIREENAGAKIADAVLGEIPVVSMLTGYFFHPRYLAARTDGTPAMRLTKQAAFWEGRFKIEKLSDLTPREELNLFLSFLMLVLLERKRG